MDERFKAIAKQKAESFVIAPFCIACRCRPAWLQGKNLWLSVKRRQRFLGHTKTHSMSQFIVHRIRTRQEPCHSLQQRNATECIELRRTSTNQSHSHNLEK